MATFSTYRAYFKYQAEVHPELLHQDVDGQRVFDIIPIEDYYADLRTGGKAEGYIFRLITPTFTVEQPEAGTQKNVQGGFLVAKYHSIREGGSDDMQAAMDASEQVIFDFVEKMTADSRNAHPLFNRSLDLARQMSITPRYSIADGGYSGWACFFNFSVHLRDCLDQHTDATWKTLTPHDL